MMYAKFLGILYTLFTFGADISTKIDKKAWRFAKLQPGRARKRMNAT